MDINFEKTKLKTLMWCIEDWTDLYAIYCMVFKIYGYKDEDSNLVKQTTFSIIRTLLEKELIVAGDLSGNIFKPLEMSISEIMEKIQIEWDNLKRDLAPEEIIWFDITAKGRKEFEYLNSLPELDLSRPIHSLRICKGGKDGADELFSKWIQGTRLICSDKLKKLKIYKSDDNVYISYREDSKFNTSIIEVHLPGIEKNLLLKFEKEIKNVH